MSLSDTSVTQINSDTKKRFRSRAWKYFRIKDKEAKLAICKICQNTFSYRTSVTNLFKHVKNQHKTALLYDDQEDTSDESENAEIKFSASENEGDDIDDNSEGLKAAKILESVENKTDEESVCLLCQMTFPDQNSDDMMKHMVKVHNISGIKLVEGNENLEQEDSNSKQFKNKNCRSSCWEYFTVTDTKLKMATCNFCDKQFSFKSTVSNLVKHIRRRHNIVHNLRQDESVTNGGKKHTYKPRSAVWSFFNYVNDDKTVCACVHCQKEFNVVDGLEKMKRHLLEEHPEALLHHKTNGDPLFITSKTDDNKGEESEEDNVQVEYLDLNDMDKLEKIKPVLKRKSNFKLRSNLERRSSFDRRSSLERRPSFSQRSSFERRTKCKRPYGSPDRTGPEPDSLEPFTNYIKFLLQDLPEDVSKKLQMNFVKQIIEAHISCSEAENNKKQDATTVNSTVGGTVDNSGVSVIADESVTVNDSTLAVNSDGTVTMANGIIIKPMVTSS